MNAEIKAQWLADLRSGEFQQGKGYLKRDGKFCCLGVLCDQAEKAGVVRSRVLPDGSTQFVSPTDEYDTNASVLPRAVVRWAGLDGATGPSNPCVRVSADDQRVQSLSSINDNDDEDEPRGEFDFQRIAEMIERDL